MTHGKHSSIESKHSVGVLVGRLHAGAALWLLVGMVGGPCDEPTPNVAASAAAAPATAAPGAPAPSEQQKGASAGAAAAAGNPPAAQQQTPTTRHYMLSHYADTVGMRKALVAGNLAEFRRAAAAVANDEWTPRLRGDYRPYVEAVRSTARLGEKADSVAAAADVLGKLGETCASCHLKFGGPGSPVAPEQLSAGTDPSMVAHAAATERLWEGLVLPSDLSWSSGMEVLIAAPKLDSDVADVAAAAHHLSDLARKGKSADVAQRRKIYASIITTCAGCHERVGVVPKLGK